MKQLFATSELSINIARGIFTLAIGKLLYDMTGQLWAFAGVFVLEFLLSLLLQGVAGSITDQLGSKRVLLISMGLMSAALLALSITEYFLPLNLTILFCVSAALTASKPFIRNGVFTLVPKVVAGADIEKLNGILAAAVQSGQIIGLAIGGLLLEFSLEYLILPTVTCCFLIASCALTMMFSISTVKESTHQEASVSTTGWLATFKLLQEAPQVLVVLIFTTFDFIIVALFNLLLAPVVNYNYDGAARWLLFLDLAFAIGAICAGAIVAKANLNSDNRLIYTALSCLCATIVFISYWLALPSYITLFAIFSVGFMTTVSAVSWSSTLQKLSPPDIRGKLSSLRLMFNSTLAVVAVILVSAFYDSGFSHAAALSVVTTLLLFLACVYCTWQARETTIKNNSSNS
ncbi:MFS transporter [Pseudoalteromonas rubra]|uniref:MFS transporter n=1 Tax=Pseudoalteromonas rubra TaxID=43658 RepID=A0A0F4QP23_9GAMM|nr:MFS transporter [Pseudoalteromonas rubra]KJZ09010.1 hypothetical protein TW77_10930 [Pseudoalteromonas rubra]